MVIIKYFFCARYISTDLDYRLFNCANRAQPLRVGRFCSKNFRLPKRSQSTCCRPYSLTIFKFLIFICYLSIQTNQFNSSKYSFICWAVNTWNFLSSRTTPTSMLLAFISPQNPYFRVSKAVWIASSIYISALYLFSRNILAFFEFLPIAVAFQLQ